MFIFLIHFAKIKKKKSVFKSQVRENNWENLLIYHGIKSRSGTEEVLESENMKRNIFFRKGRSWVFFMFMRFQSIIFWSDSNQLPLTELPDHSWTLFFFSFSHHGIPGARFDIPRARGYVRINSFLQLWQCLLKMLINFK
jgi:hypothetical protein